MIPVNYTALTIPDINDLINTFAQYSPPPVMQFHKRFYDTLGSAPYDVRGDQRSKPKFPVPYKISYIYKNYDPELVAVHVDVVAFDDSGNKGLLDLLHKPHGTSDPQRYRCTAVIKTVAIARPHNEMEQPQATIFLTLELEDEPTLVTP